VIIPPLGNEFNNMLKSSSLAEFASLYELFGTSTHLGAAGFQILEYLVIASAWYLVLTTIWTLVQSRLERRFNAANLEPTQTRTWWNRVLGMGSGGGGSEVAAPAAAATR
jgi:polar amino acid transport system permease protein